MKPKTPKCGNCTKVIMDTIPERRGLETNFKTDFYCPEFGKKVYYSTKPCGDHKFNRQGL